MDIDDSGFLEIQLPGGDWKRIIDDSRYERRHWNDYKGPGSGWITIKEEWVKKEIAN